MSGLILDPEVPFASIFTSPFKPSGDEPVPAATTPSLAYGLASNRSGISRTNTLGHRLLQAGKNFFKPFALHRSSMANTDGAQVANTRARSATETRSPMMEKPMDLVQQSRNIVRDPTSMFLTSFLRSVDKPSVVSLPFRLTIEQSHHSIKRNMPYLRQSRNRIDFLSVLCFWTSFTLATGGIEKGSTLYIGIFRALSVLKVSRLLAVTSGTAVCDPRYQLTFMLIHS